MIPDLTKRSDLPVQRVPYSWLTEKLGHSPNLNDELSTSSGLFRVTKISEVTNHVWMEKIA